jgi:hypothetical protein
MQAFHQILDLSSKFEFGFYFLFFNASIRIISALSELGIQCLFTDYLRPNTSSSQSIVVVCDIFYFLSSGNLTIYLQICQVIA